MQVTGRIPVQATFLSLEKAKPFVSHILACMLSGTGTTHLPLCYTITCGNLLKFSYPNANAGFQPAIKKLRIEFPEYTGKEISLHTTRLKINDKMEKITTKKQRAQREERVLLFRELGF